MEKPKNNNEEEAWLDALEENKDGLTPEAREILEEKRTAMSDLNLDKDEPDSSIEHSGLDYKKEDEKGDKEEVGSKAQLGLETVRIEKQSWSKYFRKKIGGVLSFFTGKKK